jgi:hypothetical protein
LLEQATFKICPKQAYNQMLAAAIQSILNKDVAKPEPKMEGKPDSKSEGKPDSKSQSKSDSN